MPKKQYFRAVSTLNSMKLQPFHSGKRLREIILAKFETEQKFADFLKEKGTLKAANQSTINRWCNKMQTITKESAIGKKLEVLREIGINPDYVFSPLITKWDTPAQEIIDESQYYGMKLQLYTLTQELELVKEQNRKLLAELAKLSGQKPIL